MDYDKSLGSLFKPCFIIMDHVQSFIANEKLPVENTRQNTEANMTVQDKSVLLCYFFRFKQQRRDDSRNLSPLQPPQLSILSMLVNGGT